jgi:hypothetical protein
VRRLLGILLLLALAVPAARAEEPVYVDWTALLPAMPSEAGNTGGPQPGCRKATMRCVNRTIRRLRARQDHFGCDHRAVFATTYMTLTQIMKRTMKADPKFFRDRRGIIFQIALFSDIYFRTLKDYRKGREVPPAWQIALDTAASGDAQGVTDMLLGINAHVQNDMPFMLAAITLRDAKGRSRKDDHDRENRILDDAYDEVVARIARRYDPLVEQETTGLYPASDYVMEMVKVWREGVWRNAERLVNAKSDQEREMVAESIHQQAATSARFIVALTPGPPGYRAQRDAYCNDQL